MIYNRLEFLSMDNRNILYYITHNYCLQYYADRCIVLKKMYEKFLYYVVLNIKYKLLEKYYLLL